MNRNGFTLLEVLISLAIFTIIGVATVKQISQIQETKSLTARELDTYNALRTALAVVRSDLQQAFHVRYDDLGAENKAAVSSSQEAPHTVFDGRKKELIFTSLSHRNFYRDRRECEQTEISYFLLKRDGEDSPSLMKRESPIIDSNLYEGGPIYTILDGVANLEFAYWNPKTGKWVDTWNSDGAEFRDKFPMAVRVRLALLRDGRPNLEVETEFKVVNPNNEAYLLEF
ncbi:MAG: prepilin-type N-terminal cleavage/methylation domain-containing protein [Bdellovibrionaceae bacterium]|nr:prepilin-type N-terminal cleavage/methylation domain-containing protein [Pseudobdellovibrionaceae bacterium]